MILEKNLILQSHAWIFGLPCRSGSLTDSLAGFSDFSFSKIKLFIDQDEIVLIF